VEGDALLHGEGGTSIAERRKSNSDDDDRTPRKLGKLLAGTKRAAQLGADASVAARNAQVF
jgi:hypothetical protein